jgi:hypothetical protein
MFWVSEGLWEFSDTAKTSCFLLFLTSCFLASLRPFPTKTSRFLVFWASVGLGALSQRQNLVFSRVFETVPIKSLAFSRVLGLWGRQNLAFSRVFETFSDQKPAFSRVLGPRRLPGPPGGHTRGIPGGPQGVSVEVVMQGDL